MRVTVDIITADVKASAEFYRKLGIEIPELWEQDGVAHHVDVPASGIDIDSRSLTRGYNPGWPDQDGLVLMFDVPTRGAVDAKFAELTGAGYSAHLEPFDAFWGARYAIVLDPDGNHVGLMSPQDEQHKAAPGSAS
ncbi:MAG TPA: VOC family protein [Actinomycetota bacterium]|nr:VOC family protein [Actinomycetota bacterium]